MSGAPVSSFLNFPGGISSLSSGQTHSDSILELFISSPPQVMRTVSLVSLPSDPKITKSYSQWNLHKEFELGLWLLK
jgi:hypothetical protein